jgi:phosphoenolpyruvate carboxylase
VLFDAIEDASFKDIHNLDGIGTLRNLKENSEKSNTLSQLISNLKKVKIKPVLTAHPTQFYPGSVLGIITDLSKAINENNLIDIKKLLSQLGKTPFFKKKKPSPYDEAVSLTWYLENVFYNSISNIQKYIKSNISDSEYMNFDLVSLGFWPGGDRDGNPYVTNEITQKTALKLRSDIIKNYYKDVSKLRRRLTFKNVEEVIIDIENRLYKSIDQTQEKPSISLEELKEKLNFIKKEVILKHESLFVKEIQELIDKVDIFGYYFASLDIRQDSSIHNMVFENIVSQAFDKKTLDIYKKQSDEEKIKFLFSKEFNGLKIEFNHPKVLNTIGSMTVMKSIQKSNGEKGCHRYIISHNESPLNI